MVNELENRIKKRIFFFIILFVAIANFHKFYSFFDEYSAWQYSDWLINYQGGFVRRGFVGEFLFNIYKFFSIDLDLLVLIFVYVIYACFFYTLFLSVKYVVEKNLDTLIFLSPGFFLYPLMNSEVVGRKDILFVAFVGIFIFFFEKIQKKFQFLVILSSIYFLSLSHTGFIFYSHYILSFYFFLKVSEKKKIVFYEIIIFGLSFFVLLFFLYHFKGSEYHVAEICNSIKDFVTNTCGKVDQIAWLSKDLSQYFEEKFKSGYYFFYKYLSIYFFSSILVFLFLIIRLYNSKFLTSNLYINRLNPAMFVVLLFLLTLPIYVLGIDWGRYIYISYSSSFFLYIFFLKKRLIRLKEPDFLIFKNTKILIVFIFFYSFFWTFPFYNADNFKLTMKKPISSLIKKIN